MRETVLHNKNYPDASVESSEIRVHLAQREIRPVHELFEFSFLVCLADIFVLVLKLL